MNEKVEADHQPVEVFFRFFLEVGIINQLSTARAERALPHGLTMSQFSVLNRFTRGFPPQSPLELANAFQVTKGAMTNTLKQLEGKGFINITPHPTDGRSKIVAMSERGKQAHLESRLSLAGFFQDFVEAFPASEVETLLPLMEKIRIWLDEHR